MKRHLTDLQALKAKPKIATKGKNKGKLVNTKYADGGGLYLLVKLNGSKLWRYDCNIKGNRKTLSLGEYPIVSLLDARNKHEKAREDISKGLDPSQKTIKDALDKPFSYYAKEAVNNSSKTETTKAKQLQIMGKYLFTPLDKMRIDDITTIDLLNLIKPVADLNKIETARRLANYSAQTFDRLIYLQLVDNNPAQRLSKLLPKQNKAIPMAHTTDLNAFSLLLRGAENYQGDFAVRQALRLLPHVFLRPKNIRFLRWEFIDFENKIITFPETAMKMDRPHKVPMSAQTISIIKEMQAVTGNQELVFSTARANGKQMSENTLNQAIRRIKHPETGEPLGKGFMTSHGFRHSASTFLNELRFNPDVIELQLAHLDKDRIRRTYNKAELISERTQMLQNWSDYLDTLKSQ